MTDPLFVRIELEALPGITRGSILAALIPIGRQVAVTVANGRKAIGKVLQFV